MVKAAETLEHAANIIAVQEVTLDRLSMYGVVAIGEQGKELFSVTDMVEKPAPDKAPSNLSMTGRYILQPEIFDLLAEQKPGADGEIQLTDAMIALAEMQPFYGLKFFGRSFDCGSKIGFLAANVAYALTRPDLGPPLREVLQSLLR
jgi:UTP--glucose-1-phosphate uridylyltransferase